jgi:hypothetical protein
MMYGGNFSIYSEKNEVHKLYVRLCAQLRLTLQKVKSFKTQIFLLCGMYTTQRISECAATCKVNSTVKKKFKAVLLLSELLTSKIVC